MSKIKVFIEYIGRHPFATGLFAIVGLLGFYISTIGYHVDRKEAEDTTKQLEEIKATLNSNCALPPCWEPETFLNARLIGIAKENYR